MGWLWRKREQLVRSSVPLTFRTFLGDVAEVRRAIVAMLRFYSLLH